MNYTENINYNTKNWSKGPKYTRVAKGVYVDSKSTYRARKTIYGKTFSKNFTSKAKAIKWYKEFGFTNAFGFNINNA